MQHHGPSHFQPKDSLLNESLLALLRERFRLPEFRKGQLPIIESVTQGNDTMAVLPTGGGKSLCYQLPAVFLNKLVVVISPLISLMHDQVRGLNALGIPAGCLHSDQTLDEKRQVFQAIRRQGPFILYLSPERVQKPGFAAWIREQDVALFAIDEAHCLSQWGPDFRTDYARLSLLRSLKPGVPILALTATATPQVLDDIEETLELKKVTRYVRGFYRSNLFLQVYNCDDEQDKIEMIEQAIRVVTQGKVLIYCGTRQGAETLSSQLANEFEKVGFYHAGLSGEERTRIQNDMAQDQIRILCATNAFGMGIDYPDVRLVIHYQMPSNVESYYQEVGRGGRDGAMSRCLLLYAKKDRGLQTFFIQKSNAEPKMVSRKWRALDAITQFIEGGECRHAGILTYFRDSERIRRCGHCDICSPGSEWMIHRSKVKAVKTKIRKATSTKQPTKSAAMTEAPSTAEAELRAEVLRDWRRTYADENDIAAFIVFSNRTLNDLANRDPKDLDELRQIYGFGESKTQSIGHLVLEELRRLRVP